MFRASLCPSSGEQRPCYCICRVVLFLLDGIGSGCGALRCRMRALLFLSTLNYDAWSTTHQISAFLFPRFGFRTSGRFPVILNDALPISSAERHISLHFGTLPQVQTLQLKCGGTRWRTVGEVKGKLASEVCSQNSSHYLGTRYIQHYYRLWRTPRLPAVDWTDAPTDRF